MVCIRVRRLKRLLLTVGVFVCFLLIPSSAWAYPDTSPECASCHGLRLTVPYDPPDGTTDWTGSLHSAHDMMVPTACGLCHTLAEGFVCHTNTSDGTAGQTGLGCVGCHGNNYGGTPLGVGMRLHHENSPFAGPTTCQTAACHTTDPASAAEDALPIYYGGVDNNCDDPCNDDVGTTEDWDGDSRGLDNDGDMDYDGVDSDCILCGNGDIDPGETCDPPASCPTTCDDGDECTNDTMTGASATCDVDCTYDTIASCTNGDGCCPTGCNANNDNNCTPECGNSVVEAGETCDPPSSCPPVCNDGNDCTTDIRTGSSGNCDVECSFDPIVACTDSDGCCPSECNATNDDDCSVNCGNDVVEPGETCDPPSSCPTTCNDGNDCTTDSMTGSSENCNVACTNAPIESCVDSDGCCPSGCTSNDDDDCSANCGNDVVEAGETCDPPSSCPTTCNDGNDCTVDSMTGSAANCNVACTNSPIVSCSHGDACCPVGCDSNIDDDCSVNCGNDVVEAGETCDPPSSCPTTCNDGNDCTIDSMTGSAANCNVACTNDSIVSCTNADGCCPAGCDSTTDDDCSVSCGNDVIETGETCDPPSSCPTTCNDGNDCTLDSMTGSSSNCNVACTNDPIVSCTEGDWCCPAGCDSMTDGDCSVSCGNDVIEAGETCDPPATCPETCNDGNSCTLDSMTGSSSNCNVACSYDPIVSCGGDDGCCPAGCDATTDNDCSETCGNGTVEPGETCDPPESCPETCNDGNDCTLDTMTGSSSNCNVACNNDAIISCADADLCCPAGCDSTNDTDCSFSCGNSIIEEGETCDPPESCPSSCDDGIDCTVDSMTGSASNCNAACTSVPIVSCAHTDGCCPAGCDYNTDDDCSQTCGNDAVEPGETCDPPESCPASCDDDNGCTIDAMTGSAANCNASCSYTTIVSCDDRDACCPAACDMTNDDDCSRSCGDGIIDRGESCDPPDRCPTSCEDRDLCTDDFMTGSAENCNARCNNTPAGCVGGDGCCPPGCEDSLDFDCLLPEQKEVYTRYLGGGCSCRASPRQTTRFGVLALIVVLGVLVARKRTGHSHR